MWPMGIWLWSGATMLGTRVLIPLARAAQVLLRCRVRGQRTTILGIIRNCIGDDYFANSMAGFGDRCGLALLGLLPICAGADHESCACGLRGCHRFEPDLAFFAAGPYGRVPLKVERCRSMSPSR